MKNLKISIVTPSYNCGKYLEHCILSIMNQTYQNFEHIVIDGGSTDNTIEILKKYEGKYNLKWISEKDNGMYDAINKGFNMADGDIFAWLNADDCYLPWAFSVISSVMQNNDVQWCNSAYTTYFNQEGVLYFTTRTVGPSSYSRKNILKGYHDNRVLGFIQQETTFWTKELWTKSGGVDIQYRYAGDYYLWQKFAEYENLYSLNTILAGFRKHDEQLTNNIDKYYAELPKQNLNSLFLSKTKILFLYSVIFKPYQKFLLQIENICHHVPYEDKKCKL